MGIRSSRRQNVLVALFLLAAPSALVITAANAAPQTTNLNTAPSFQPQLGEDLVLWRLFESSLIINSIILLLSVIAVALFIYFIATINDRAFAPSIFIDEINNLVRQHDYKKAVDYCRDHQSIFAGSIVRRCLENAEKPHAVLMTIIESEGQRRSELVWNRISFLSDISSIAPMLGLLGTVLGMIRAFFWGLPQESASLSSAVLSQAIGGAMATTLFGLIVGIASLVFYSIIRARATRSLATTEQIVHALADQIKRAEP